MAFGGGVWATQNKILPGAYINFVSAANTDVSLSDRGIATIPVLLNWGPSNTVLPVTIDRFRRDCFDLFGYEIDADEMVLLREIFRNAQLVYFYRLNGGGEKAANAYGTARYAGTRGNDLKVTISIDVDDAHKFDVTAYLGAKTVDYQVVSTATELKDSTFIIWKKDADLAAVASAPMTGGTNGQPTVETWNSYFQVMESYSFNAMGVPTSDETIKRAATAYVKRMRESIGKKFQVILHKYAGNYEGVINVDNACATGNLYDAVFWVTGAEAGCKVNASCMNKYYDGELDVNVDYTQAELEDGITAGKFLFHKVGDETRVLMDLNSLTTFTADKSNLFQENQTIRVCDQIATDIAVLFNNKYLGKIPNDADGRSALWVDICKHHEELQRQHAIEGFQDKDVTVAAGKDKRSVVVEDNIIVVNAMAKLYMAVVVA